MLYFTSDLHFGHDTVAKIRGFDDSYDHDQHIVDQWCRTIKSHDHVWILGDLSVGKPDDVIQLIKELPGRKHLVSGNHDRCHPIFRNAYKYQRAYLNAFDSVQLAERRRVTKTSTGKINAMISHFPYFGDHTDSDRYGKWRLKDCGDWIIHGHIHSDSILPYPRSVHVGWDAWNRFVEWPEIQTTIINAIMENELNKL